MRSQQSKAHRGDQIAVLRNGTLPPAFFHLGRTPMRDNIHDVIATDIPAPVERAPLELDDDLTRKDAWMFVPLIATAVTLPLVATVLLAVSAGHLINNGLSIASTQPATFASRWQSVPVVR